MWVDEAGAVAVDVAVEGVVSVTDSGDSLGWGQGVFVDGPAVWPGGGVLGQVGDWPEDALGLVVVSGTDVIRS